MTAETQRSPAWGDYTREVSGDSLTNPHTAFVSFAVCNLRLGEENTESSNRVEMWERLEEQEGKREKREGIKGGNSKGREQGGRKEEGRGGMERDGGGKGGERNERS